jgi:hypothetical protein
MPNTQKYDVYLKGPIIEITAANDYEAKDR